MRGHARRSGASRCDNRARPNAPACRPSHPPRAGEPTPRKRDAHRHKGEERGVRGPPSAPPHEAEGKTGGSWSASDARSRPDPPRRSREVTEGSGRGSRNCLLTHGAAVETTGLESGPKACPAHRRRGSRGLPGPLAGPTGGRSASPRRAEAPGGQAPNRPELTSRSSIAPGPAEAAYSDRSLELPPGPPRRGPVEPCPVSGQRSTVKPMWRGSEPSRRERAGQGGAESRCDARELSSTGTRRRSHPGGWPREPAPKRRTPARPEGRLAELDWKDSAALVPYLEETPAPGGDPPGSHASGDWPWSGG